MVSAVVMSGTAVEARCSVNKAGFSTRKSRAVRARAPQRCVLQPTCSYSSEREPLLITASQPLLAPRSVLYFKLIHVCNLFSTRTLHCVTSSVIVWHHFNNHYFLRPVVWLSILQDTRHGRRSFWFAFKAAYCFPWWRGTYIIFSHSNIKSKDFKNRQSFIFFGFPFHRTRLFLGYSLIY